MTSGRFPVYMDMSGFDFATSEIKEATVHQLRVQGGGVAISAAAQTLRTDQRPCQPQLERMGYGFG